MISELTFPEEIQRDDATLANRGCLAAIGLSLPVWAILAAIVAGVL